MKRILVCLLAIVTCLSFIGCTKAVEESEPLVQMQEIQPSGTVNLGEELALFSQLLDNNYINVNAEINDNGYKMDAKINAKRTEKGYDAIIEISDGVGYWKLYYIDGVELRGYANDGVNFDYIKIKDCHYVDLIGELNEGINSQIETKLIYHVLKPLIHKFKGFENVSQSDDYAGALNSIVELLKTNRDSSVYDFVLGEIMGVDLNDEDAKARVKADFLEFCSGNPSVAVFIDKIEGYVNTFLGEENKISIKGYLDGLQQASGITTKELVELVEKNFPSISDNLRDATEDETFYDYIRSYFKAISLNAFTKNIIGTDKTFVDFIDCLIEESKGITVEYAFDWIVSNVYIQSRDENGDIIIYKRLQSYLDKQIIYDKLFASLKIEVDENGRPIKIECSSKTQTVQGEEKTEISEEISAIVTINYSKTDVEFTLPIIEK